jgi:LCP family protein required for cell wall assembly
MTDHDIEILIRQAVADEASHAVDAGSVLHELQRRGRSRGRRPIALVAAAGLAAAAVAVAVIVPLSASRDTPQVAAPPAEAGQNVLLIGLDGDTNTDSVVLAHVGADGAVSAVSLPRDALVTIPGQGTNKLNSAYATARQGALEHGSAAADAEGAKALVATVEQLTGVDIAHYASVDMTGFDGISRAVGGVEVCLSAPSQDPFSGADFPAGRQTLVGEQALAFLRQRHGLPRGDLDRVVRQQAFLSALVAKVLDDPSKLAGLVTMVRDRIHVDEGWDLVGFAQRLTAGAGVRTATIPVGEEPTTVPGGAGQALPTDPAAVRAFVAGFFTGGPSSAPGSGTPASSPCVS